MDPTSWLGIGGVALSALAGYVLSRAWLDRQERWARTRALLDTGRDGGQAGMARWRLRRGVPALEPVAEALLRVASVRRYLVWAQLSLEERGYATTQVALLTLTLFAVFGCVGAGWVLTATPVFGLAVAAGSVALGCSVSKNAAEKRAVALRDEIPDALRSLGVCFKVGLSLMQTLRQTGSEMQGPLGEVFLAAARTLESGGTASEALALFRGRPGTPELAFVAVALDVQHQVGGSLLHVLEAARESVEGEIELSRSLKIQTAQARLSARIVTLMPFALIALFSLMSPGFLSPFFASVGGMALLAVALAMQAGGVLLVRRSLDVAATL